MQPDKSTGYHPLEIYFRHNLWSNLLLFDACIELDAEQLEYSADGTYGSIQSTLAHIVSAEEWYIFHITTGEQMADTERPKASAPLVEMRERIKYSSEILHDLAISLDGTQIVKVGTGEDSDLIPIEALLLQVLHHAHEHRTQVESMLGQLGLDPPGLSGWRYFEEQIKD
jgi:uncharacterized damage-inducible protein DinB